MLAVTLFSVLLINGSFTLATRICQYHYNKHFHNNLFLGAFDNPYMPELYTAQVIIKTHLTISFLKHNCSNKLTLVNGIPILIKNMNPKAIEASNKYLLKQSSTSILLIMAIIINLIYSGQGIQ
eukprot:bmy_22180T0